MASSIETTSKFFFSPRSIKISPVFVPSSVVQYVSSFSSVIFPGLNVSAFPLTDDTFTDAPSAFAKFSSNVSLIFFPNSDTRSRIAWSTVPWSFGGTFKSNVALCPTELKYILLNSSIVFGVFFLVPQNHPDVIRASASGTVHLFPFSNPIVAPPWALLSIVPFCVSTLDFDQVSFPAIPFSFPIQRTVV